MESLADLPLDLNDDEELERDLDEDNEDLDSDMVEINHEDGGDKSANETEDADKKSKTPIWKKPQKKKGGKKQGGGGKKSKSAVCLLVCLLILFCLQFFVYIFSETKTAANKKKDPKATGENATSTDAQSTNQNVSWFHEKKSFP